MGREEQQGRKGDAQSGEVSLLCACVRPEPFRTRCALRKTSLCEELQLAQSMAYVNNAPDAMTELKAFISQHR